MFSFVCGSVSCKETVGYIGWHSVRFVCFLQWYLRAASPLNKHILFFTFFIGICTHICCTAAPSGSLIRTRHKILVDHSMCFHILFSFQEGNVTVVATVYLYSSLNFVPVLAVSLMWYSGICLSLPRTTSSHQRYLDPWTTVLEFFLYQNDTYID